MPAPPPLWSGAFALGFLTDRLFPHPAPAVVPVTCSCWCDCEGTGRAGLLFYVLAGALGLLVVEGGVWVLWKGCRRWTSLFRSLEAPRSTRDLIFAARAGENLRAQAKDV